MSSPCLFADSFFNFKIDLINGIPAATPSEISRNFLKLTTSVTTSNVIKIPVGEIAYRKLSQDAADRTEWCQIKKRRFAK